MVVLLLFLCLMVILKYNYYGISGSILEGDFFSFKTMPIQFQLEVITSLLKRKEALINFFTSEYKIIYLKKLIQGITLRLTENRESKQTKQQRLKNRSSSFKIYSSRFSQDFVFDKTLSKRMSPELNQNDSTFITKFSCF